MRASPGINEVNGGWTVPDKQEAAITEREFDRIIRERRLQTVFQPIVHLGSGATVGCEALVRGPEGSFLTSAKSLLAAAYRANRVVEFDWVARASACRTAMAAGLREDQLLFLNIEPLALDSDCPHDLWPDIKAGFDMFRVVLEVTERSLDRDPGSLLDGIERQRPIITGLALDDVGSDPVTLAMLPLVAPAVIKLDLRVTRAGPTPDVTHILDIVYEEAERTDATILAEGIETAAHFDLARSLGATLGQGHYFSEPVSPAEQATTTTLPVHLRANTPPTAATPFDALEGHLTGRATASLLIPLSQQMEFCGIDTPGPALLIEHLPDAQLFGPAERHRLARSAQRGVTTAVLGPGVPVEPGDGIRGIGQRREPELVGQWAVVTLSPCSTAAMLARASNDAASVFEFGITHDTQRVIAAARCLFRRLGAPEPRSQPMRGH